MSTDQENFKRQIENGIQGYLSTIPETDSPFQLTRSHFNAEELTAAVNVLLSGQVSMGKEVKAFEQEWNQWLFQNNHPHSLMVNSGSSANLLALTALGSRFSEHPIAPGDEVIVPAVCWSTSVFPIVQAGAIPVFVDVDPETLNLCPESLEQAIGPKTRGIVVVHVLGNPCDMPAILALAKAHDLWVLEDSCESHGASIQGQPVGTFGDISTFSFFLSHHITTIEGGMVCFQSPQWRDFLISQRAHGWIRERSDEAQWKAQYPDLHGGWTFVESGYNLRPTEMHAAIGRVQLASLDQFIAQRQKIWQTWASHITEKWGHWLSVQKVLPDHQISPLGLALQVNANAPFQRSELQTALQENQIFTRPLITGNFTRQPVFKHLPSRQVSETLAAADQVHEYGFMVGLHHDLSADMVTYFLDCLDTFLQGF